MELQQVQPINVIDEEELHNPPFETPSNTTPFIEANTVEMTIREINTKHTIPNFVKDNESTISHTEFVEATQTALLRAFPGTCIGEPLLRVSHPIMGRIAEAKGKPAKDLLEHEKTLYYERSMFTIELPEITAEVGGNHLALTVGGVKAYNLDNLYAKKGSPENFKVFIGFKNRVCTNLCISTDGLNDDIKTSGIDNLIQQIAELFIRFNIEQHLAQMKTLLNHSLTEHQFAQLIGKAKLYQFLCKEERKTIPELCFGDYQMSAVARDYYSNYSFSRDKDGTINLWKLYNLFTGANKSSYIDKFLERGLNASQFTQSLQLALANNEDCWFLN